MLAQYAVINCRKKDPSEPWSITSGLIPKHEIIGRIPVCKSASRDFLADPPFAIDKNTLLNKIISYDNVLRICRIKHAINFQMWGNAVMIRFSGTQPHNQLFLRLPKGKIAAASI
jgi:hypothetical protein